MKSLSKSYKMLEAVIHSGGMSISEMAEFLETSESCVKNYINFFRNSKKGHDYVPIRVENKMLLVDQWNVHFALAAIEEKRKSL